MKLARYLEPNRAPGVGIVGDSGRIQPLRLSRDLPTLAAILEQRDPAGAAGGLVGRDRPERPLSQVQLLPPIDQQEVWAAGVTYKRSRTARMEESANAATLYDRVYDSPRPELFLKATPHRVAGHGQALRIRADSKWNVPEPELALVLNSRLELVGFTARNDMSSRNIEGENPLYLPQAKIYNQGCGLGPWITLAGAMPNANAAAIGLRVLRAGQTAFSGSTSTAQMARSFQDLIGWLGRDNSFPTGAFLSTGTGIVPDSTFTLQRGDSVEISIEGIGTLTNPVVQG